MKTNELKKGDRVRLRNGWYATIADNKITDDVVFISDFCIDMKGNTLMATVEGHFTEMGSVYAHDIVLYFPVNGEMDIVAIEHTPKQLKWREIVESKLLERFF